MLHGVASLDKVVISPVLTWCREGVCDGMRIHGVDLSVLLEIFQGCKGIGLAILKNCSDITERNIDTLLSLELSPVDVPPQSSQEMFCKSEEFMRGNFDEQSLVC